MRILGAVALLIIVAAVLTHDTAWLTGIVHHGAVDIRTAWSNL